MYCRNCGRKVDGEQELCAECEAHKNTEVITEEQKQEVVQEVVETQTNPIVENVTTNNENTTGTGNGPQVTKEPKSKLAAGLFGIFLGVFGVHNFYLGYTGKAVAQLLITVLSCGFLSFVSAIWGLIEGIMILAGEQKCDANGNPLKD